jgi:hypothetical protein
MKLLIRLFPRSWRERYREEIADHLARSTSPARDRLDLLMALAPMWADDTRRLPLATSPMYTRTAAAILGAIAVLSTLWATGELEDGVAEMPQHWWSTAAVLLPLMAAALVLGLGELKARRTQPH